MGSDAFGKMADKLGRPHGNIRSVVLGAVLAEGRMTHASVEFDGVSGGREELYYNGCVLSGRVCEGSREREWGRGGGGVAGWR